MDMTAAANGAQSPALCLDEEKSVELADCVLKFTPLQKETDLYVRLEKAGQEQRASNKQFQLFIVRQADKVVETKILPLKKKFKPSMAVTPILIACVPTQEWHKQTVGDLEISQRSISIENVAKLGHISADQLVDENSKRGLFVVLAAAFLLVTVGIFAPKGSQMETAVTPPKVAQKIIVKTELKPKRKRWKPQLRLLNRKWLSTLLRKQKCQQVAAAKFLR